LALVFVLLPLAHGDKCSSEEKKSLRDQHKKCTDTVQQRYSVMTVMPENSKSSYVSTPMVYKTGGGGLHHTGLSQEHVCSMIEETVRQCAQIYKHCFNDQEMRSFQDAQLMTISEIMEQVYNMGAVVSQCEIMLEFDRSGRDGILPTKKCELGKVKIVSKEYQKCIETANEEMSIKLQQQTTVEAILDVLCDGMNKIVHDCASHLYTCYTHEEINETKVGQLELTKQIFKDIMAVQGNEDSNVIVDLGECSAYNTLYLTAGTEKIIYSTSSLFLSILLSMILSQFL